MQKTQDFFVMIFIMIRFTKTLKKISLYYYLSLLDNVPESMMIYNNFSITKCGLHSCTFPFVFENICKTYHKRYRYMLCKETDSACCFHLQLTPRVQVCIDCVHASVTKVKCITRYI